MANNLISTALIDDPDPDGTDVYGMIPLIAELPEEEDEDDERDERDERHYDESGADEEDHPPVIEASSIEIELPKGKKLPDDDDEAFEELTEPGGLSPGEAKSLITYMRPLTMEEVEIAENPYLNDLRWVDDPAHVDDLLKEGKGDKGLDDMLDDSIYGDDMRSPEELAEKYGDDRVLSSWKNPCPRPRAQVPTKTINKLVVSGLNKKLVVEHANWLAGKDEEMGITVRPRSYYENVARLWANDKLKKAQLPTTTSGNWGAHPGKVANTAQLVLNNTKNSRLRFSSALGASVDMGGWSPFKSIEHAIEKGASLAYKGAKFGVTKPFVYVYKGVKYVGNKAAQLALAPIKAVVRRFRNKTANQKAAELARQRGLTAPGPAEKAAALTWTKNVAARSSNKLVRLSSSLMGSSEYGIRDVDISLGSDVMGLSASTLLPLVVLGPVGLLLLLESVYKSAAGKSSSSPQDPTMLPDVNPQDSGDPGAGDPGAGDPGASDPGASDPGAGDPGASDPGAGDQDPGASDADQYDSSGVGLAEVTLEQLNAMPRRKSAHVQQLIRSGRVRLA